MKQKIAKAAKAPTAAELRQLVGAAEKRARAAKSALKVAKKLAKGSKRDLKRARKELRATEDRESKTTKGKPSGQRSPTKQARKTAKKQSGSQARTRKKKTAVKPKVLGSRIASSPEVRRRARLKKPRATPPITSTETTDTSLPPAVDAGVPEKV